MKFMHYKSGSEVKLAVCCEDRIFDVAALGESLPADFAELLNGGEEAVDAVAEALIDSEAAGKAEVTGEIVYAPAVPNPGKILCIGKEKT